jgi:hypothetical protein
MPIFQKTNLPLAILHQRKTHFVCFLLYKYYSIGYVVILI